MRSLKSKVFSVLLATLITTGFVVKANIKSDSIEQALMPQNLSSPLLDLHGDLILAFIAIISISIYVYNRK